MLTHTLIYYYAFIKISILMEIDSILSKIYLLDFSFGLGACGFFHFGCIKNVTNVFLFYSHYIIIMLCNYRVELIKITLNCVNQNRLSTPRYVLWTDIQNKKSYWPFRIITFHVNECIIKKIIHFILLYIQTCY